MARKLKVFRTAIGFHDAYVAATSRKAALAAWGADADLFARGVAEEVTEAALTREPLAHPGEVIRVSRGDLAAHLKALPPTPRKPRRAKDPVAETPAPRARRAKAAKPPPSREPVDAAEQALDAAERRHAKELGALTRERDALERRIETLRARQAKERDTLERARGKACEAYRKALDRWSAEA